MSFAALALLLRVAVPVGFMPSSVGHGWYLELCPDGMPVSLMVELYGEHHAHHGADDNVFYECDYGGGVVGAVALDCGVFACGLDPASGPVAAPGTSPLWHAPFYGFRSRAPPPSFVT